MKHKLSQWHSADTKPVHVGVYQVKCTGFGNQIWYSYWNNERWSSSWLVIENHEFWSRQFTFYQNKQWRGIVK